MRLYLFNYLIILLYFQIIDQSFKHKQDLSHYIIMDIVQKLINFNHSLRLASNSAIERTNLLNILDQLKSIIVIISNPYGRHPPFYPVYTVLDDDNETIVFNREYILHEHKAYKHLTNEKQEMIEIRKVVSKIATRINNALIKLEVLNEINKQNISC